MAMSENLIKAVNYGKERDQNLTEPIQRATIMQAKKKYFERFGLTLLKRGFCAESYKYFLPKYPHQRTWPNCNRAVLLVSHVSWFQVRGVERFIYAELYPKVIQFW